jgi:hypothetical protein
MADEEKNRLVQPDNRPAYDPPRATRLRDFQTGSGGITVCNPAGSGDSGICTTGNGAVSGCISSGNSPITGCFGSGNSAPG